jgi:hypothetical protein
VTRPGHARPSRLESRRTSRELKALLSGAAPLFDAVLEEATERRQRPVDLVLLEPAEFALLTARRWLDASGSPEEVDPQQRVVALEWVLSTLVVRRPRGPVNPEFWAAARQVLLWHTALQWLFGNAPP